MPVMHLEVNHASAIQLSWHPLLVTSSNIIATAAPAAYTAVIADKKLHTTLFSPSCCCLTDDPPLHVLLLLQLPHSLCSSWELLWSDFTWCVQVLLCSSLNSD
jgi:hypothetical protein